VLVERRAEVAEFEGLAPGLVAGGLFLLPVAAAVEGPPPALSASALLAFGYVSLVATALAFAAWFTGLRHLSAGTVGLIGLLNPVTGVLLGTTAAGEVADRSATVRTRPGPGRSRPGPAQAGGPPPLPQESRPPSPRGSERRGRLLS
jgi:probable blue pigment (indigoidine) exporter